MSNPAEVGRAGAPATGRPGRLGEQARLQDRPRPQVPDDRLERALVAEGFQTVVGLDEVGRGAWAGPVSVGAAVFVPGRQAPEGLRDSKLVPEARREELFPAVTSWCAGWAVGHAGPEECDRWGMTAALRMAARRALAELACRPDAVLLDGSFDYLSDPPVRPGASGEHDPAPDLDDPPRPDGGAGPGQIGAGPGGGTRLAPAVRTVVRGDAACVSIAAASIVAKVTRDRMMRDLAGSFPGFDFDRNKGYPSPVHRRALAGMGLTSIHRRTWSYAADLPFG